MVNRPKNLFAMIFECLDKDPKLAKDAFYHFTHRLFVRVRPYHYGAWVRAGSGREVCELENKLFLHCADLNFRRLRRFVYKGVDDEAGFRNWLLRTADRLLISDLRDARRRLETVMDPERLLHHPDRRPGPDEVAASKELVGIIENKLAGMRPRDRKMIDHRINDRKPRDVAKIEFGSDDLTARKRASDATCNAVDRLKRKIRKEAPELVRSLSPDLGKHFSGRSPAARRGPSDHRPTAF